MSVVESEREALIAWSSIAEPSDEVAMWVVDALGATAALEWVRDAATDPVAATMRLAPFADGRVIDRAVDAVGRWVPRLADVDVARAEERAAMLRTTILTRADLGWPEVFEVLGPSAPYALWVRGGGDLASLLGHAIAVVGSRASTTYGEHVAAEIAGGVGDAGWCVVSGGAYGIDAAAHRAALTSPTPTVAVMAGGVDRLYPAGHHDLLHAVMERGAVVSEVPIGFAPHRQRFLARNRLIAAAAATCVVEAAARSGALNTVNHAVRAGRPVGAVPGPATSVSSQGCHALIRDGLAVLVADARQLLELAGPIGTDPARDGGGFADPHQRAAFDAIRPRGSRAADVARGAGLTVPETLAALAGLEMAGLAAPADGVWRRSSQLASVTERRTN